MAEKKLYVAAVGIKVSQIHECFWHLFWCSPCAGCGEATALDEKVITTICEHYSRDNLLPMTLCRECLEIHPAENKIEVQNPELNRQVNQIIAERN